jgi:hypothetical protein
VRRKRAEQRSLLLLADRKPRFERRDRARPVPEPRHRHELPGPALIGLALADRNNEEAGPAEVEVLDVQPGDLGPPPPPRQTSAAQSRGRERGRRRPLERERRGEPLGGDGGPGRGRGRRLRAGRPRADRGPPAGRSATPGRLAGERTGSPPLASPGSAKYAPPSRRWPRKVATRAGYAPSGSCPRLWACAVNCRQPVS